MTTQAAFTPQEWTLLRTVPARASYLTASVRTPSACCLSGGITTVPGVAVGSSPA